MSRTASSSTTATTRSQAQGQSASTPATQQQHTQVPREKIAARAYEKWVQRGRPQSGSDTQDWLEAEAELKAEQSKTSGSASTYRY